MSEDIAKFEQIQVSIPQEPIPPRKFYLGMFEIDRPLKREVRARIIVERTQKRIYLCIQNPKQERDNARSCGERRRIVADQTILSLKMSWAEICLLSENNSNSKTDRSPTRIEIQSNLRYPNIL